MQKNNFLLEENTPKNQYLVGTIVFKNWTKKDISLKLNNWFDFSDISILSLLKEIWISTQDIIFNETNLIPSDSIDNSYDTLNITKKFVKDSVRNITLH